LIAIAHRVSERYPFILAANRDEDYERPSREAHWWEDAPFVFGGRDVVHGGSWLAITNTARFAAVTNLRGAVPRPRSRGALVRDFVTTGTLPDDTSEYSGFHLLAGQAGGKIEHLTHESRTTLSPGIHSISNAPLGEEWPKTTLAIEEMQSVLDLDDPGTMLVALMHFLTASRNTGRVESEVFIAGDRYGTRASTVIIAGEREIVFAEQTFARGGIAIRSYSRAFPIVGSSSTSPGFGTTA
jgi:uncharacterized protein with NRDE domain